MKNTFAWIAIAGILIAYSGTTAKAQDSSEHHQKMEKAGDEEAHHEHQMNSTETDTAEHSHTKKDAAKKPSAFEKQKMKAMIAGKYNCCIEESCDECLKTHGECQCKKAVKNDKPVCDECYQGWKDGKGDVSGKKFSDIKSGHKHNH